MIPCRQTREASRRVSRGELNEFPDWADLLGRVPEPRGPKLQITSILGLNLSWGGESRPSIGVVGRVRAGDGSEIHTSLILSMKSINESESDLRLAKISAFI